MWKKWDCALELDMERKVTAGSYEALREAINRGADLRIFTSFLHSEHIESRSGKEDMVQEVSDFPCTYLIDKRWAGGIMTLRQPVSLPDSFGPRASMSFFMYNEDGQQACARPYLDGGYEIVPPQEVEEDEDDEEPCGKNHFISGYDNDTNAPSINFIWDFFQFRYMVNDCWEEIYASDAEGNAIFGSIRDVEAASLDGCELKVGISGICGGDMDHTVFIQTGPHYFYHEEGVMVAETRPFVRVKPAIPLRYESKNWDFGWNIVRSDGQTAGLYYDPYTLRPFRTKERHAIRWFVKTR